MKNYRVIATSVAMAAMIFSISSCGIYGKYRSDNDVIEEQIFVPSYREIFTEPELVGLIDTALARNLDLRVAHERVNQADAQFTAAKLAYLPHIHIGGSPAVTMNATSSASTLTYTMGTAAWEIDIFGRLTNRKRIAKMTVEQMKDYEQAARTELISAVATLYYTLQMLDAQIAATDEAEKNWKESVNAIKAMKEAGLSDEAGVSQFEGSYYGTRAAGKSLRYVRTVAENSLLLLLSSEKYDLARGPISAAVKPKINVEAVENLDLNAVRVRPDVRAAEMRLAQSFYNVNLARANCCPSISLGGTIGWANGGLLYNAIGGLLQPLFNAGENLAALRVSKSQYEESKMAYASALLNAGTDVNNAVAGIKSYRDQIDDCHNRVEAMARALEATQLKMKFGRGTYIEVLIAQNDLLDAQIDEISNTCSILTSIVDLYQSLGGGKE